MPGLFVGILSLVVADETAEDLFPFVLVLLAIPIGLMVARTAPGASASTC